MQLPSKRNAPTLCTRTRTSGVRDGFCLLICWSIDNLAMASVQCHIELCVYVVAGQGYSVVCSSCCNSCSGNYLLLVCQYCPISGALIKTLFIVPDREQHHRPESVANKVLVPYWNLLNHQQAQRDSQRQLIFSFNVLWSGIIKALDSVCTTRKATGGCG